MDIENNNITVNPNPSFNDNPASTIQTPINLNNIELPINNVSNIQNFSTNGDAQKPKKGRKLLFFFLGILVGIALFIAYTLWTSYQSKKAIQNLITYYQDLSDQGHENQTSGLYSFTSSGSYNGEATYGLEAVEGNNFDYESYLNGDNSSLLSRYANSREAKLKDNPWIEGLYDFRSFIYLDLSFSGSTLLDRDIIEKNSKKSLGKLTIDELNKKYNYKASHKVNKLNIDKKDIKLSELKEGEIYQYTIKAGNYISPKFTNDLSKTVIFYKQDDIIDTNSLQFDSDVLLEGESEGGGYGISSSEHTYSIYYKIAVIEDILKKIGDDDIIYLSKFNTGEEISFRGEEQIQENGGVFRVGALGDYMYNDTEEILTIKILDEHFGEIEEHDTVQIQPGELYKRYWAADTFILSNGKIEKDSNNIEKEIRQYYENEETKDFDIYSEGQAVQARVRDTNRKNDLAQIEVGLITLLNEKGTYPAVDWDSFRKGIISGAANGMKISDISNDLYSAGMSSIPSDPSKSSLAYGLGNKYGTKSNARNNGAEGDYLYIVSTRNGVSNAGFVLMAKTESEIGSNWVVCKNATGVNAGYITNDTDIAKIKTCSKFNKGNICSSNSDTCSYTDTEELRYISIF